MKEFVKLAFLSPALLVILETPKGFLTPRIAELEEGAWRVRYWEKRRANDAPRIPRFAPVTGTYLPSPQWVTVTGDDNYESPEAIGMLTTPEDAAVRLQAFAAELGGRFFTDAQIREIEQTAAQGGCYLKL